MRKLSRPGSVQGKSGTLAHLISINAQRLAPCGEGCEERGCLTSSALLVARCSMVEGVCSMVSRRRLYHVETCIHRRTNEQGRGGNLGC